MGRNTTTTSLRFKFISRLGKSWRVWVVFGLQDFGQAYFSDRHYGSVWASFAAAQGHRDALVAQHQIPARVYAGRGWCVRDKRNTFGQVGVTLMRDSPEYPQRVAWSATVVANGKPRRVTRSVRRYGYHEAWRHVAQARAKFTRQPMPDGPPEPPAWLVEWASRLGVDLMK